MQKQDSVLYILLYKYFWKNTFLLLLKKNLRRVLLLKYLKSCLLFLLLKYLYQIGLVLTKLINLALKMNISELQCNVNDTQMVQD